MSATIRYLTRKGDPRLQVNIFAELKSSLIETAKQNKRTVADQFIWLMGFSLKNEATLRAHGSQLAQLMQQAEQSPVAKHIQIIPLEMLTCLKDAAQKHGYTLDQEITLRLLATLKMRDELGASNLSAQILNKKFNSVEIFEQLAATKNAYLYQYEMEKLKLFVRFQQKIPRRIKESFVLIDVKEATKLIQAELEGECDPEYIRKRICKHPLNHPKKNPKPRLKSLQNSAIFLSRI